MTVTITIGFLAPPEAPYAFPGGGGSIRVAIDGDVLTKYEGVDPAETEEELYDVDGNELDHSVDEFTGENLAFALGNLHDALVRFQTGDFDRYEEVPAEVKDPSSRSVFVLSFVDGDRTRIAFQPLAAKFYSDRYRDGSLRGYVVHPDDLCRELIDCYREWKRFVGNAYPDHEDFPEEYVVEFHEAYDEKITELEDLIGE